MTGDRYSTEDLKSFILKKLDTDGGKVINFYLDVFVASVVLTCLAGLLQGITNKFGLMPIYITSSMLTFSFIVLVAVIVRSTCQTPDNIDSLIESENEKIQKVGLRWQALADGQLLRLHFDYLPQDYQVERTTFSVNYEFGRFARPDLQEQTEQRISPEELDEFLTELEQAFKIHTERSQMITFLIVFLFIMVLIVSILIFEMGGNRQIGWSLMIGSYALLMISLRRGFGHFYNDQQNEVTFERVYAKKRNYFLRKGLVWSCSSYIGRQTAVTELKLWLMYKYFSIEDYAFDCKSQEQGFSREIKDSYQQLL